MSFKDDFDWQAPFLPTIRRIVGPLLLEPAPLDLDMKEATDMLLLRARDMRIGCRLRRPGYAERYPWEFTLRSKRDSGADTELEKIRRGWGDWIFYGHAGTGTDIPRWFVVDLAAFRRHLMGERANRLAFEKKSNYDGTHFIAFDIRSFQLEPTVLVASSHPLPHAAVAA